MVDDEASESSRKGQLLLGSVMVYEHICKAETRTLPGVPDRPEIIDYLVLLVDVSIVQGPDGQMIDSPPVLLLGVKPMVGKHLVSEILSTLKELLVLHTGSPVRPPPGSTPSCLWVLPIFTPS